MNKLKTLTSGIMAGMCIGVGGIAYLSIENHIIGAFLFSVGLFTICTFRLDLFTGKISRLGTKDGLSLPSILIVLIGNMIGAFLIAELVHLTRVGDVITQGATALCQTKLSDNIISLFILAMLCNAMIYIAVELFNGLENPVGAHLAIIFGIMVFVLCGFEHSIADMFYFAAGRYLSNPHAWGCIGIAILGNACGGILCHSIRRFIV